MNACSRGIKNFGRLHAIGLVRAAAMISPHERNHNPLAWHARDEGRPWKSVL
jgi:hypothetical protein